MEKNPLLVVLIGPTGVGKSDLAIALAEHYNMGVISADSRQVYKEIPIGTAAPSSEDLNSCKHYFIGTKSITEPYSASLYEQDVLSLLNILFRERNIALVTGGSMMYVDALCHGIDEIPDVKPEVRKAVYTRWEQEGLENILEELKDLDPVYYKNVDKKNYKRVLHGYEICLSTGRPFSSYHTRAKKERPFDILKIGIILPRPLLYERINRRVCKMIEAGLEKEARAVYEHRNLNALNTVGYKEMFAYMDGDISLAEAIRQIQKNSRVYARKQLTWWKRQDDIHWFEPTEKEAIIALIDSKIAENP
ncbi:tRNA delta(2)-isopentenylpyrophosphate transferase [Porphyromonas macacae]|uniref:tRNA (adenosine(37)-N6)-dimethylallyltransferase MiaA n=1 Tax=Porphyromonas macacae TaxID=28115 RepID=UPI00052DB011|nr:tRNA (adenosine(37)-N6)-dimethylallyltransferase MiaA [Porphyromonas macacae]KGN99743.1 tRNA delta(2)-isopentenylpyrophosphate transferase [Porphyromonas macacae]